MTGPLGPLRVVARELAEQAGAALGVDAADVLGSGRSRTLVVARHAVWLALRRRGHSYPEIGRACGYDHTSVLEAVRRRGAAPGTELERRAWTALGLDVQGAA